MQTFFTALVVTFVLLIHNGAAPIFLLAYAILPFLIVLHHKNRSPWPLVVFLIVFGAFGRYTRYLRQTYASDALLATRDFVGYFLAGKHPYKEMIMAQSGLTPFTYLPFSLFWYAPAYILGVDLRFFEMIISSMVPVLVATIGWFTGIRAMLPTLAVVSLTPFLLDLSSDGSNDNSAVFLLLLSIAFLLRRRGILSAIALGLAASFKHYLAFYLLYFVPFVLRQKTVGGTRSKTYLGVLGLALVVLFLPFVVTAREGFWRSLRFIELTNWHTTWGWNVWVLLRDGLGWEISKQTMWGVRTVGTGAAIFGCFVLFKRFALRAVFAATSITMLVYLALSNWTSYAYFTFLVPLIGLAAGLEEKGKSAKEL